MIYMSQAWLVDGEGGGLIRNGEMGLCCESCFVLVPHPWVVENTRRDREAAGVGGPEKERGPSLNQGLHSPESQPRGEEFSKTLTIKIREDSGCLDEMEGD